MDQCGTRLESLQTQLISQHTLELECCLLFNLKSTCMLVGTCQADSCRWRQPQRHPQGWWSTTPWSSTTTPTSSFFWPMSPCSLWFPSSSPPPWCWPSSPPPPSSLTNPFSLDHPFSGHHFRARASFLHFPPFLFTTNHRHHLSSRGDFSTKGSLYDSWFQDFHGIALNSKSSSLHSCLYIFTFDQDRHREGSSSLRYLYSNRPTS